MRDFCVTLRSGNEWGITKERSYELTRWEITNERHGRQGDDTLLLLLLYYYYYSYYHAPTMWGCGLLLAGRAHPYTPMRFVGSPASARIAASATS